MFLLKLKLLQKFNLINQSCRKSAAFVLEREMDKKVLKGLFRKKTDQSFKACFAFAKWVSIALIMGIAGGLIGSLFHMAVNYATSFRQSHNFMIFFMPIVGVLIIFMYRICKIDENMGTNIIISSVRTEKKVPPILGVLIFISTVLTHLTGGSVGREGAALQIGGSIGEEIGKKLKLDEKDMGLAIMCGMSSVFAALFGTPLTAAFFAMEVISVGIIYYVGLVPCVAASLMAYKISLLFHLPPTKFNVAEHIPRASLETMIKVGILAAGCGAVSMIFCIIMKRSHKLFESKIKNSYIRALVGGFMIILLTLILQTRDYNGAGGEVIKQAVENGRANHMAFILKIIFTAITLGTGFKGGEIVPTFFIGATFGCAYAPLIGLDPHFGAAIGLAATFCGVVNCPAASIFLSYELFGGNGLIMFAAACGVSYMLSGYYGLYTSQKIVYSKFKPEFININAH